MVLSKTVSTHFQKTASRVVIHIHKTPILHCMLFLFFKGGCNLNESHGKNMQRDGIFSHLVLLQLYLYQIRVMFLTACLYHNALERFFITVHN